MTLLCQTQKYGDQSWWEEMHLKQIFKYHDNHKEPATSGCVTMLNTKTLWSWT